MTGKVGLKIVGATIASWAFVDDVGDHESGRQ